MVRQVYVAKLRRSVWGSELFCVWGAFLLITGPEKMATTSKAVWARRRGRWGSPWVRLACQLILAETPDMGAVIVVQGRRGAELADLADLADLLLGMGLRVWPGFHLLNPCQANLRGGSRLKAMAMSLVVGFVYHLCVGQVPQGLQVSNQSNRLHPRRPAFKSLKG